MDCSILYYTGNTSLLLRWWYHGSVYSLCSMRSWTSSMPELRENMRRMSCGFQLKPHPSSGEDWNPYTHRYIHVHVHLYMWLAFCCTLYLHKVVCISYWWKFETPVQGLLTFLAPPRYFVCDNMYSGTSLFRTPLGQKEVSLLVRCPDFRGRNVGTQGVWDGRMCPVYWDVLISRASISMYMYMRNVQYTLYAQQALPCGCPLWLVWQRCEPALGNHSPFQGECSNVMYCLHLSMGPSLVQNFPEDIVLHCQSREVAEAHFKSRLKEVRKFKCIYM